MNSHSRQSSEILGPAETMAIGTKQHAHHHRKTMSYNDANAYKDTHGAHNRGFRLLHPSQRGAASAAAGPLGSSYHQHDPYHSQQQPKPPPHHPYVPNQQHHHGTKPSLAGFDPFSSSSSSSAAAARVISPSNSFMGRDSAPTRADLSDQQRQPNTPPSLGRPIATPVTPTTKSNFERFANETSHSKSPMKKVNKFLRKATATLSLSQHSPNSGKDKASLSPGATKAATPPSPPPSQASSPGQEATPKSRVALSNQNHGLSVSVARGSLETTKKLDAGAPPVLPNISGSSKETSMAQDLLELQDQFGNLQIPSLLAKNAPTSFLTGRGDEVVQTSCSSEPTPFQLEIPSLSEVVTIARLNEFVENYRRLDQNLDLKQFVGCNRMQLQHRIDSGGIVPEHVPIVQSLLDCADGEISLQGFLTESGDLPSDSRAEAAIFQGQRNFTVVFRGTTDQQVRLLGNSKSKKRAVPLDPTSSTSLDKNVEVYSGFLETYSRVEEECFRLVDKLVDENPFCDVVFSGYSFGAAMATLASFRYATARPMMRVGCLTLASPKVGFSHFRHVVNTSPNLKVMRLELGGQTETKCQGPTVGGWHVGHTLVLNGKHSSSGGSHPPGDSAAALSAEKKPSVSVYKFETPKHKSSGFFKTANPGLKKYISILEDLATLQKNNHLANSTTADASSSSSSWPKDFANNAGEGVVVNNEKRLVV